MRGAPTTSVPLLRLIRDALATFEWNEEDHPRDEHGRFGTKDGADKKTKLPDETKPLFLDGNEQLGWTETSEEDAYASVRASLDDIDWASYTTFELDEEGNPVGGRDLTSAEKDELANLIFDDTTYAYYAGPNGAVAIISGDEEMPEAQQAALMTTFGGLLIDYPRDDMVLHVSNYSRAINRRGEQDELVFDDQVGGATMSGFNVISINDDVYKGFTDGLEGAVARGFANPVVLDDPGVYALTHEFGHTLATEKHAGDLVNDVLEDLSGVDPDEPLSADEVAPPSQYALSSSDEAYAEAFAVWRLTGGTTDNAFTREMAEREGWK